MMPKKIDKDLKHIHELFKQGNYKVISDDMIEVDGHTVKKQTKQGRLLLLCNCQNHARFSNSQAMCIHKQFFLMYPLLQHFDNKLYQMINFLELNKELSEENQVDYQTVIDDLKDIRRLK